MTLQELIQKLINLDEEAHGQWSVVIRRAEFPGNLEIIDVVVKTNDLVEVICE